MNDIQSWIFGVLYTIAGYFLKKTIDRADKHDNEIRSIENNYLKKEDAESLKGDIEEIKKNYTPRKDFDEALHEIRDDLKDLNKNSISRDEFIGSQRELSNKLDQLMKMMMK